LHVKRTRTVCTYVLLLSGL